MTTPSHLHSVGQDQEPVRELWCMAEVESQWGRSDPRCSRPASEIIGGQGFCWQHARIAKQDKAHWEMEERSMAEMQKLAPEYGDVGVRSRVLEKLGLFQNSDLSYKKTCGYCNRKARTQSLVVNPRNLRRIRIPMCGRVKCYNKLNAWQNTAGTRRARAEWDMDQEVIDPIAPARLLVGMRMQYPSVSRATLRAFLESDMESATVENGDELTASALNGSIRVLGFQAQVFAEIRDGVATLRRVPGTA